MSRVQFPCLFWNKLLLFRGWKPRLQFASKQYINETLKSFSDVGTCKDAINDSLFIKNVSSEILKNLPKCFGKTTAFDVYIHIGI